MEIKRIVAAALGMTAAVALTLSTANYSASARESSANRCAQYLPGTSSGPARLPLDWVSQECPLVDVAAAQNFDDDFARAAPCTP